MPGKARNHTAPIGFQIRTIRKQRGLTLKELAKKAGTSAPTMHRYEGNWEGFSLPTLRKIAHALNAELEIRLISREELVEFPLNSQGKPNHLEVYRKIRNLFWDRKLVPADLDNHPHWILRRILTEGYIDQVRAAVPYYGYSLVSDVIEGRGIDPKTKSFWQNILKGKTDVPQSAQR